MRMTSWNSCGTASAGLAGWLAILAHPGLTRPASALILPDGPRRVVVRAATDVPVPGVCALHAGYTMCVNSQLLVESMDGATAWRREGGKPRGDA